MDSDDQFKRVVTQSFDKLRIDYWLKKKFPDTSYITICKLLRKGSIRVNGVRVKNTKIIKTNDIIKIPRYLINSSHIKDKKKIPDVLKSKIRSWVTFLNDDFIILNKPSGIPVQGGTKIKYSLDDLLSIFEHDNKIKPKLVHRIDKDTSGLLIVSRNLKSAQFFTKLFKEREILKTYLAIVNGKLIHKHGIINFPIKTKNKNLDAKTFFKRIHTYDNFSFIALRPKTGRKNQIRKHLLQLNLPILGEKKFVVNRNLQNFDKNQNLNLHAYKVSFRDMNGKFWEFKSTITKQMKDNLRKMNFDFMQLEQDFFLNAKNWKSINEI